MTFAGHFVRSLCGSAQVLINAGKQGFDTRGVVGIPVPHDEGEGRPR